MGVTDRMDISPESIAQISFPGLITNNGGIVFTIMLMLVIVGFALWSGVKNAYMIYLLAIISTVISVFIGAASSNVLLYLTLPLVIMLVLKFVIKPSSGGTE